MNSLPRTNAMAMPSLGKSGELLAISLLATLALAHAAQAQRDQERARDEARVQAEQLLKLEFELERANRLTDRQGLRERFEAILKTRVDKLDRQHTLSNVQQKKLILAGRVDIDRYFARAEELEHRLSLARGDADAFPKVFEEIKELQLVKGTDLFGDGSFYSKVLGHTLTREQTSRSQAMEQKLSVQRHQAALVWVLATWDQTLKLSHEQHRRLERLLAQTTRPPRRFGEEDYFGVLLQVSRLPERELKAILREDQWTTLLPELAEAKRREPMLRRDGYVPESDVVVAPSAAGTHATKVEKKQG